MTSTEANTVPVRTIALLNQKGGVGKTTTTVNLGAAIAEAGRRVLLVDLDPQAHLTLHLGIEKSPESLSVYDVLIDPDVTPDEAIVPARERLDVLPAETDLAAVESELAQAPDRLQRLAHKLKLIHGTYDYILFDCPPSLGMLTLNALAAAREVFVPMQAHFLALQGVGKLLETVGLVCRNVNPSLAVTGIILCMHEQQTTLAKEVMQDLESFFDSARTQDVPWRYCRVLKPAIRRNIKVAEAPSFGQTIFDYAPWCPGAIDYRKLAEGLINDWEKLLSKRGHTVAPRRTLQPPKEHARTDEVIEEAPEIEVQVASNAPSESPAGARGE